MKAMLTGFAAIVIVSAIAWFTLERAGFSSAEVFSGSSVRLD